MPTVLVVDDTKFSRGRAVAAIKSLPVEIVEAADGQEALDRILAAPPDVVVSDLLMPRMTGLELVTELRARGFDTPVIIVSADIQATSRAACHEQGVLAFINKPFNADVLQAAVKSALETSAATVVRA